MSNKDSSIKISVLTVLFFAWGLSACLSHWQGDLAKIVIPFTGAGRAAYYAPDDNETLQALEHKIVFTNNTETLNFSFKGTIFEAYVTPGNWNISVCSWLDDDVYAAGVIDANLQYGQNNIVKITMSQAHLIRFNSNGGSAVPDQVILHNKQAVEPPAPQSNGFQFEAWYADSGLTEPYNFNKPVTQSVTLYAQWNAIIEQQTHLVRFDSNGGSAVPEQTVIHNDKAVEPSAPVKSGYQFGGWYADSELEVLFNFNNSITESITLYAKWVADTEQQTHLVTFVSNGGSAVPDQTVIHNEQVAEPSAPVKSGYEFGGWYADSELTERYDFNEPVTESITLYAKWNAIIEQQTHLVKFESNGGSAVPDQTVIHNEQAVEPSAPEKSGYEFGGWYADSELTERYDFNGPVTESITLYAQWNVTEVPGNIEIIIGINEWELLKQTARADTDQELIFTIEKSYASYQWYLDGVPVGTDASYEFVQATAGTYEIAVIVTDSAGNKRSGSCQVIVR